MRVRKRPVEVEARLFDGNPSVQLEKWLGDSFETWLPSEQQLAIRTREGEMIASAMDYIIKGVAGEFYPCKPEIFDQTYDILEYQPEDAVTVARTL